MQMRPPPCTPSRTATALLPHPSPAPEASPPKASAPHNTTPSKLQTHNQLLEHDFTQVMKTQDQEYSLPRTCAMNPIFTVSGMLRNSFSCRPIPTCGEYSRRIFRHMRRTSQADIPTSVQELSSTRRPHATCGGGRGSGAGMLHAWGCQECLRAHSGGTGSCGSRSSTRLHTAGAPSCPGCSRGGSAPSAPAPPRWMPSWSRPAAGPAWAARSPQCHTPHRRRPTAPRWPPGSAGVSHSTHNISRAQQGGGPCTPQQAQQAHRAGAGGRRATDGWSEAWHAQASAAQNGQSTQHARWLQLSPLPPPPNALRRHPEPCCHMVLTRSQHPHARTHTPRTPHPRLPSRPHRV